MKAKIRASKNGQYYVAFYANNGRIVFNTETYTRKAHAKKTAEKIAKVYGAKVQDTTK